MLSRVKRIPKEKISTRKGSIINPGLIWNKTCILVPKWYGNPKCERKKRREWTPQKSKWTYNLSIFNFIQMHSYWNDKLEIWSKSSAIVWRKADRVYRYRCTFLPSAINRYFMVDSSRDKYILWRTSFGVRVF